jgi:hypothetical protein
MVTGPVTPLPPGVGGKQAKVYEGWDKRSGQFLGEGAPRRMLDALRAGNHVKASCGFAGVSYQAMYAWLARAREVRPPDGVYDRDDIPESELVYVDFLEAVQQAEAMSEVELVTLVRSAARTNWQAAVTMLSRRFPHWRETTRLEVEVSHEESEAMQLLQTDPALVAQLAQIAHGLEDARARQQVIEAQAIEDFENPPSEDADFGGVAKGLVHGNGNRGFRPDVVGPGELIDIDDDVPVMLDDDDDSPIVLD